MKNSNHKKILKDISNNEKKIIRDIYKKPNKPIEPIEDSILSNCLFQVFID